MAQKRMFDKTIIDSDTFLDMPLTTQALYFHLNMRADDDGFIDNWKTITKYVGAKEDDIKILIAKQYIIPFDSGVIVIRHWRINNYLQKDRKKATRHLAEIQKLKEVNGEYFLLEEDEISNILLLEEEEREIPEWQKKRDEAYKNSSLPYSFLYKIRNAFIDCKCPICNNIMTTKYKKFMPTIQHLIPISKGGEHEINNIAIICLSCNSSIRDREISEKLNNNEVKEKWAKIIQEEKYLSRLTSGNIEENRIDKIRIDKNSIDNKGTKKFTPPTLDEVKEYISAKGLGVNAEQFYDYFDTGNWVDSKGQKVKNWKQKLLTWNKYNNGTTEKYKPKCTFADILKEEYGTDDEERDGRDTNNNADLLSEVLSEYDIE